MSTQNKFIKFVCIGGASTAIQIAFLALFVELNILPEVSASFTAYLLSSIFNYLANYYLTFASKSNHSQTFPKFVIAVAIGLTINTVLFWIFLHILKYYLLAQCLATGITLFVNFAIQKLWIYRD